MKAYGNLMNRINEEGKETTTPEQGKGLTAYSYTDRYAYTITRVDPDGKKLWAVEDITTRADANGMGDSQTYNYRFNERGTEELFTLRKDGKWHMGNTLKGLVARVGFRDKYHDYGF